MKIISLKILDLRNNEYLQFHGDFSKLMQASLSPAMGLDDEFAYYTAMLAKLDASQKTIRASLNTPGMRKAEKLRNSTYRSMRLTVRGYTGHYDVPTALAAKRIMAVFRNFGNLPNATLSAKTKGYELLVSDLTTGFAAELALLNMLQWVAELKAANEQFIAQRKARAEENAIKPKVKAKKTRPELDKLYRKMVKRINALIEIHGEEPYAPMVNKWNETINSFRMMLALRKGRNKNEGADDGE